MTPTPRMDAFGLNGLLTPQDDPALWEAVLQAHWAPPSDPASMLEALRFSVGRRLAPGEEPQGDLNHTHYGMRGMVDVKEWCFERLDADHLQPGDCPPPPPPGAALSWMTGMSLMSSFSLGGSGSPLPAIPLCVFVYLGVSRPSLDGEAVVFSGSSAPGMGDGGAWLWRRGADGAWAATDECIARWLT